MSSAEVDDRTYDSMKIALLQINPTVGDLAGNARLIADARARGGAGAAPISPSRRSSRSSATCRATCCSAAASSSAAGTPLAALARDAGRPAAGARRPARAEPVRRGTAAVQHAPRCCATAASSSAFRKALLPTYDVFDEDRYFEPFHGAADARARRPPARHQHLRGHLERSRLLEAPPLPPRSDRGARRAPAPTPSSTCRRRRSRPASTGGARRCSAAWRASTACRSRT